MLKLAFAQMAEIYDPPSNFHHKFAVRRRGAAETPLAFRSALLSLAQAAFPKMEQTGLDSLRGAASHQLFVAGLVWDVHDAT
ncbi:unnamed protein product [Lampetra planeri]